MLLNLIKNNQSSLLSNSFYLYLSHFADYILTLFFLPFIVISVGAIEFGKISLVQTFGILIILVMEFGSSLMATREVARIKSDRNILKEFIGKVTTFKILLIPIALLISIVALIFIPIFFNNSNYLLIVTIGAIFQGFSPTWYFQGVEKMKEIALTKIVFRIIGFMIILSYVRSSSDGWIVLASFSLSSILICIYLYLLIIKKLGFFNLAHPNQSTYIFVKSINSFVVTIVPVIFQNISVIILSIFVNPLQLGFYYGANRIYRAFNTLYGPISQAFFPIISSASNKIGTTQLIKKYFLLIFTIGLFFFLVNFFFAEKIILILFGNEFSPSIDILRIFSIILPLTAISNTLGRQYLLAMNKDSFYSITQLFSSLIALCAILYFITKLGAIALPVSLIFYEISSIIMITIFLIYNEYRQPK